MRKYGKELTNQTITTQQMTSDTQVLKEDSNVTIIFKSGLGDEFKMIFSSPKREKYASAAAVMFEKIIGNDYTLYPESRLVYLRPSIYWNIYKRFLFGKEIIKGTGNKLFVNGECYHFPDTQFYFSDAKDELIGDIRGVYGIYYDDILLYIGSSVSGVIEWWKEHDSAFRTGGPGLLYTKGFNADEIRYELLVSLDEIGKILGLDSPARWLVEFIESICIKTMRPVYNVEGKTSDFRFKIRPEDNIDGVPLDYWKMIEGFLEEEPPMIKYKDQAKDFLKKIEGPIGNPGTA